MMQKPTTLQDIADLLGMHKSTVSLALSGKGNLSGPTRERIRLAAEKLGYVPDPLAQRLAGGGQNALVCLYSSVLDVGLATEKILLIQRALTAKSLDVPIYTGTAQVAQLRRLRPRAILCAAQQSESGVFAELKRYQEGGGIVICYDTPVPLECDQVLFDREDNAYKAARYLLERGHRKLGLGMSLLTGPMVGTLSDPQTPRIRGFQKALAEFGVPFREEWFFRTSTYEQGGAQMAQQFLALRERPTGLCIVNDYAVLAFMSELGRAGVRIPEELSVVGHDNRPVAEYCPVPLTAASQPVEQLAAAVVERLTARLAGEDAPPQTVVIQGQLIERDSVAAPSTPEEVK